MLLGAGLVVAAGLWLAVLLAERRVREETEALVEDTERMLSGFEIRAAVEPVVRHRHRAGRHRRRKRPKGGGGESD
ncbi:MAG TPA: hypothetical protein VJB15_04880 [Rhodothermia bacterium]|nr:hypothetical protein [Rhodothermia bacterium]